MAARPRRTGGGRGDLFVRDGITYSAAGYGNAQSLASIYGPAAGGPAAAAAGGTATSTTARSPEVDWLMDKFKGRFDSSVKTRAQEGAADAIRQVGAGLEGEMNNDLASRGIDDTGAASKAIGKIKAGTASDVRRAMTDIEVADQARLDNLTLGGAHLAALPTQLMHQGQYLNNATAQTASNIGRGQFQDQMAYFDAMYGGPGGTTTRSTPGPLGHGGAARGGSVLSGGRRTGVLGL
jgi:hypothetical protein